ncbi:hypothetical protein HW555_012396 [Spodoptera exigua]|uniref:Uncharacterized protein n=1 Tax=Spodoptera exigua TaxID=7107 RepID=A0A835G5N6_SPOEX|nr:hypothetical protein HW555_012396 [Spodoptera exigua]
MHKGGFCAPIPRRPAKQKVTWGSPQRTLVARAVPRLGAPRRSSMPPGESSAKPSRPKKCRRWPDVHASDALL